MKNLVLLAACAIVSASLAASPQLPRTASAHGIVDQQNEATGSSQDIQAFGGGTTAQQFTPLQTTIVGADVELVAGEVNDATMLLTLWDGPITGPGGISLGQTLPEVVPAVLDGEVWVHFDFATPLTLVPGRTYSLIISTDSVRGWVYGGDTYPGGAAIVSDVPDPDRDFSFRTYSQPTPTPTPSPQPTATPSPEPTATPTPVPTATPPADVLPPTGSRPAGDSGFPWAVVGLALGGLVLLSSGLTALRLSSGRR